MSALNLRSASPEIINDLRAVRWRCRHDLIFLCHYVLGFTDVSEELHGPVVRHLQGFPEPKDQATAELHDKLVNGHWEYTPLKDIMDLEGKRRMLLLDSRGFLKTTINCIAHSVQWIINYPDLAMLVMQSNSDKANMIVSDIKRVFQSNDKFRAIFPELCPQKRVWEWGRQDSFTVEDRRYGKPRGGVKQHREPTVMAASIERGMAGIHVDIIKCSDIVEPSNINGEGLETVKRNFFLAQNLLVAPQYWIDVEGTRYHFEDLYGKLVDMEAAKAEGLRNWKIFIRGATKRDWGGKPETFDSMDFLMKPEIIDKHGYAESRWPARFGNKYLATMKMDDPLGYATQQQQDPRPGGVAVFPVNHAYPKWISNTDFIRNIRVASFDLSVDTAETSGKRSDYTSIAVAAWSGSGKCYIVEIVHGRLLPSDICDTIVKLANKYRNRLGKVKIEETGFVRGMMPALRRQMDIAGHYIPIDTIKRDNQEGKIERIANTLQPWYHRGDIVFVGSPELDEEDPKQKLEGIPFKTKRQLLKELREFPACKNDDILDSLSDLFQNKEWFGREFARGNAVQNYRTAELQLLGLIDSDSAPGPTGGLTSVY